jgi:hypothetical protein
MTIRTQLLHNSMHNSSKFTKQQHNEISCCLPSLVHLADTFECPVSKSFCEVVCTLFECSDLVNFDVSALHCMRPKSDATSLGKIWCNL